MTTAHEYDASVAFHSAKPIEEIKPDIVGLPWVIHHLGEMGVGSLFVPKENYNFDQDEIVGTGYYATSSVAAGGAQLDRATPVTMGINTRGGITAIRSRIVTPQELQGKLPIINTNGLRKLGASKSKQYDLLGEFIPPTFTLAEGEEMTDDQLTILRGDRVVIKADSGMGGKHNKVVTKESAPQTLEELRAGLKADAGNKSFLLQEYTPSKPFSGLRASTEAQQAAIDTLDENPNDELRMFCFADLASGGLSLRPYGQYRIYAGEKGKEAFLAIDQDTIPEEAYEVAEKVTERILDAYQVPGVLAAVDLVRLPNGSLSVREVNLRDPSLTAGRETDAVAHPVQMKLLAEQLASLAMRSQGTNQ